MFSSYKWVSLIIPTIKNRPEVILIFLGDRGGIDQDPGMPVYEELHQQVIAYKLICNAIEILLRQCSETK